LKPRRLSVSVAIFRGSRVLIVQRPADDADLPNLWGLPASTLHPAETFEQAVRRTGRDKLGIELEPVRVLEHGTTERTGYTLEMQLWEARLMTGEPAVPQNVAGITQYQQWAWGNADSLRPAAERGSLCSKLFLDFQRLAGRDRRFRGYTRHDFDEA
jgi:ADP-ribose pyrophosphatase YjhB (NUDIX family)